MKALDLFCGAGGAAMGLHRAGFEVVGVDIEPQPHYPFEFHQAHALTFDLAGYDLIWASPPCQQFSVARNMHGYIDYPELVEPTRRMLVAANIPYVIENVTPAPLIKQIELCGTMFGLKLFRHRAFESSHLLLAPPHKHRKEWVTQPLPSKYSSFANGATHITVAGHNYPLADGMAAMGIDWMKTRHELSEAIPPAYSEYIARQVLASLR